MTIYERAKAVGGAFTPAMEWPLSVSDMRIWRLCDTGNGGVFGWQTLGLACAPQALACAPKALECAPQDLSAFTQALAVLPERQALLCRHFEARSGGLVFQTIDRTAPVQTIEQVLKKGETVEAALFALAAAEQARPLELKGEALLRFTLLTGDNKVQGLLIAAHPLLADPQALNLIATALLAPDKRPGEEAAKTIADAMDWLTEQAALSHPTEAEVEDWYRRLTAQETFASLVPLAAPLAGEESWRELDATVADDVDEADLLAALAVTLRRYCGCNAQRIGVVTRPEAVRLAVRTEDIRIIMGEIDGAMTLMDARSHLFDVLKRQAAHAYRFEALADALRWRDESFETTALVKTLLDVRSASAELAGVERSVEPPARRDAGLVVTVFPARKGLRRICFGFEAKDCDARHVARFIDDFLKALAVLKEEPQTAIGRIAFVTKDTLDRLSAPYPDRPEVDDGMPLHEVIAAQARRRPDAFAVAQGDKTISHGALEVAANRLAHRLIALGIGAEKRVAVALPKSIDAIIAILAVLKAGGAFTPVEPDHPEARNRHILTAPGLELVISRKRFIASLPGDVKTPVLDLDNLDLSGESSHSPHRQIAPDQLAYVIYTSGSTGVPKGVAVEHGPLAHHLKATLRIYEMSENSCEYPVLPFTSDGGHERWMVPLMAGGGVVLSDDRLATPEEAYQLMSRYGVNNASLPTSYVRGLAEYAGDHVIPKLRLYSFGGEALSQAVFDQLSANLKAEMLINGYGPTETIMTPMIWKITPGTRFEGTVAPIGRGVGDRRIYVLDQDLQPVPVGVIGEIYIGGSGLARGYLGQPELTAERFVTDPYAPSGGKMYKSGDLGRWREDGIVEFAGRVDHQIKLRGYRIEPGEIEAVLRADPAVAEAVVLLHEEGGRRFLVAYVVPREGEELTVTQLRRAALAGLPDYMVPQAIMLLERLPMGPNAKLDRAALPAPVMAREMVAPETAREKTIAAVWCEVLDLAEIGVTENFFEIGGQSLAAVRIVSKLKSRHPDWPLTIADMFNYPTVRDLALATEKSRDEGTLDMVYLRRSGERPLLYCFPGLLVSTREYMRLVDYLGPDQPATGFICYSLTETKTLSTRVEDITARYAEAVRREAKGRPCAFLGWSWGGLLAYEAARQLGDDIDLKMIGMVDVCDMDEEFTLGLMPRFAPCVREQTHAAVQDWLKTTPMREDWQRLFSAMDAEVYEQFLAHIIKHKVVLPTDGPDIGSEEHTFWILIDNAMIFRTYRLQPSQDRIHAFVAEDSLTRALNVIDWRRFSPNATAPELVTGTNHLTIIGRTPFHQRFARRLDQAFEA
ncbi:amino acid adenylation domain-containing protein [Allorhizobium sp. BGMRC 0089]|uniref:amino acid adenylation domain-containing protein n=1 Tax=Allorhizobium sonneratiae TaxID=2934936 RepID=UPI002033CCD9|nr:amino acid adenylation domain-containing protein [Allorhizobium sonneratiae]MCM2293116.1 amino acid adenylation domain-containing protein [Allorhizobium sonneratiae]